MASTIRATPDATSNRINFAAAYNDINALQARATVLEAGGLPGVGTTVTTSAAASTANLTLITYQVKDSAGNAVAAVHDMDVYLSDASTGAGLPSHTPSGGIAAGASGIVLIVYVTAKALRVQTNASGVFILAVTDSSKTHYYPCAVLGRTSKAIVGTILADASYG